MAARKRLATGLAKAALIFAALGITPNAVHAQVTVVKSTGPSSKKHPVGKKLANGARVTLASGDKITVLNAKGTKVLQGPGSFTIGSSAGQTKVSLVNYLKQNGALRRVRAGAVRGSGDLGQDGAIGTPTIWFMEPDSQGTFCRLETRRLFVWRPRNQGSMALPVLAPEGDRVAELTWEDGSRVRAWPKDDAPLEESANFRIDRGEDGPRQEITFVGIPEEPETLEGLIDLLVEKDCKGQLDRLIAVGEETATDDIETDSAADD